MRIGVFGGTFDPVHFGHINLALSILESQSLDEVWWIPVKVNPLKVKHPVDAQHRIRMLKLALEELPLFKILEIEIKEEGPSYTINTLRMLKSHFPQHEFHLLLGDDALHHFMQWKEPEEILRLAPPLVGARQSESFPDDLSLPTPIAQIFQKGWTAIPLLEISATNLRKRLSLKKFCGHMMPAKVLDYIHTHHLYL